MYDTLDGKKASTFKECYTGWADSTANNQMNVYVPITTAKPPLGVMPKQIWKEQRIQELCKALYERSSYKIDDYMRLWVDELRELLR